MLLRHEGKKNGSSPLKGKVRMICFLKPALISEKNTLNDNPSPKARIADGHDPLSLTRNDYKKSLSASCLLVV